MSTKIITVLAVLALIVGYFYFLVDWETRALGKQLDQLIELVEKDRTVSKFEALGRSRKLPDFFTENPSIEYFPRRHLPEDADSMSGAFLSVWGKIDTASVSVIRHEIEIDEAGSSAESTIVVRSSVMMGGSEKMGDTLKYRIDWEKSDGNWRIRKVVALGSV